MLYLIIYLTTKRSRLIYNIENTPLDLIFYLNLLLFNNYQSKQLKTKAELHQHFVPINKVNFKACGPPHAYTKSYMLPWPAGIKGPLYTPILSLYALNSPKQRKPYLSNRYYLQIYIEYLLLKLQLKKWLRYYLQNMSKAYQLYNQKSASIRSIAL